MHFGMIVQTHNLYIVIVGFIVTNDHNMREVLFKLIAEVFTDEQKANRVKIKNKRPVPIQTEPDSLDIVITRTKYGHLSRLRRQSHKVPSGRFRFHPSKSRQK